MIDILIFHHSYSNLILLMFALSCVEPKFILKFNICVLYPQFVAYLVQILINEQENRLINLRFFPNVSAAAGYGANNDNESFKSIPVTASFLTTILRIPAKEYDVINVLGNSMEPFLKDGDMVLVLPTHEASNGEIVIANLGGDLYVKKLLKDPIKKRIRLTSMNELYEDIVVEDDELDQLKIVGIVKKVLPSGAISI